jgi:hypothetical protein
MSIALDSPAEEQRAMSATDTPVPIRFFHGTKADLRTGDLIAPGYKSNYGTRRVASWIYLTGTMDAAIWGAELARGEGRERIYIVEPTGDIVDDPNLTDQKFPGNPTQSYRSREPIRVVGEVTAWEGHSAERLAEMRALLARLDAEGVESID